MLGILWALSGLADSDPTVGLTADSEARCNKKPALRVNCELPVSLKPRGHSACNRDSDATCQ